MHQLYQAIGPRPGDWPQLLEKMLEATTRDFDYMEQMTGLRAMTLIVAADEDIFPPAHAVEMFELLGGARDEQMPAHGPCSWRFYPAYRIKPFSCTRRSSR